MNQTLRPGTLGAVAYLNMLPFFADDPQVLLCESPAKLNALLSSGALLAGCCSVIAGLEAGLEPLVPHMGVAAEATVGSVYLEPLGLGSDDNQMELWSQWLTANRNGASRVDRVHTQSHTFTWPRICGRLRVLTCGASAQSLWIVKTLWRLQGFETEVLAIPEMWHTWPEDKILQALQAQAQATAQAQPVADDLPTLTALLVIGDPALVRKHSMPGSSRAAGSKNPGKDTHEWPQRWPWRLDVADLWASFSGLPCLFALWFASRQSSPSDRVAAAETLAAATQKWLARPSKERAQVACGFLAERGIPDLLWSHGTAELERYLNNLRYDLNLPSYAASLQLMGDLARAACTQSPARLDLAAQRNTARDQKPLAQENPVI